MRGQQLQQYDQWQKPEVRTNLGEDLTLNDPIKRDRDVDSERQQRALLWQRAHSKYNSFKLFYPCDTITPLFVNVLHVRVNVSVFGTTLANIITVGRKFQGVHCYIIRMIETNSAFF